MFVYYVRSTLFAYQQKRNAKKSKILLHEEFKKIINFWNIIFKKMLTVNGQLTINVKIVKRNFLLFLPWTEFFLNKIVMMFFWMDCYTLGPLLGRVGRNPICH
jgi:hypothetical protein